MRTANRRQPIYSLCLLVAVFEFAPPTLRAADDPVVTPIYKSDFEKDVDVDIWHGNAPELLPVGGTTVFAPGWTAKFSKTDLPDHKYVRARIALTIIGSADGSDPAEGPDNWSLLVEDGTLLLLTNFRNALAGDQRGVNQGIGQAFPDEFPAGLHTSGAGAKVFKRIKGGLESQYEIEVVFPHRGPDLGILIQSGNKDHGNPRTEHWGIRSFEVELLSGHFERGDEDLAKLWKALVGADPVAANRAVWEFVAAGEKGVEYVRKAGEAMAEAEVAEAAAKLDPFKKEVAELVDLLDSEVFRLRQTALEDLTKLPREAIPLLEAELEKAHPPEVAAGIKGALRLIRKLPKKADDGRRETIVRSRIAHVLRVHDNSATGRKFVASESSLSPLVSLDDGYVPEKLTGSNIPRFDWWQSKGGNEGWVQYEFQEARIFDSAEVFWYENLSWDEGARLPESWRLSYLDGEVWKPVKQKGEYGITHGEFDRVEFEPVETTKLRLTAKSAGNRVGLVEFRLGEKGD